VSTLKVQNIQHTNGTSGMTISSGGVITQPAIPCCFVKLTTGNAQDNANPYEIYDTDIRFDTIDLNQGNCYSESTGRFTVPVAGVYEAKLNILTHNNTTQDHQIKILKNGSLVCRAYHGVDSQYIPLAAHCLLDCNVGDYFTAQLQTGQIFIDSVGSYSMFSVKLVG